MKTIVIYFSVALVSSASWGSLVKAQDNKELVPSAAPDSKPQEPSTIPSEQANVSAKDIEEPTVNSTAEQTPTINGGHFGAFTGFGTGLNQNFLMGFMTLNPGIILGLGVNFGYNGNSQSNAWGLPGASSSKVRLGLALDVEYMFYNKNNIAVGPQLILGAGIAPDEAFNPVLISPGLVFWYTPWNGPIAIGASWNVNFTIIKNANNPVVDTFSPTLRLAWIFS